MQRSFFFLHGVQDAGTRLRGACDDDAFFLAAVDDDDDDAVTLGG